jgi:hypothetical protein
MNNRGDWQWNHDAEFFFDDAYGGVCGGLNHIAQPHQVWFDLVSGNRDASGLLALIQTIHREFQAYELRMVVYSQSNTRQLLDELAAAGWIKWEEIRHSNSREARFTHVSHAAP